MKDSDTMEKVKILDPIHKKAEYVSVIRYFEYQGQEYFVYCYLDKPLENGRISIYVTKLRNKISIKILDSEWIDIYQYLRMIGYSAKEEKDMEIHDLELNNLKGVIVSDYKLLSLSKENLPYFIKDVEEPIFPSLKEAKRVPTVPQKKTNYQVLYEKEVEENEQLKKRIEDLENLTLTYEFNFKQIQQYLQAQEDLEKKS